MKKSIFLCLLLVFTTSVFVACSSDELVQINDEKLYGVWFENFTIEDKNQTSRLEYRFNVDNTYEVVRMRIDNVNGSILGYRYRELGTFNLRNNTLFFSDIRRYVSDDTGQEEVSEIENLQLVSPDSNTIISHKIELRDNERILEFITPPCNDTGNCLALPLLKKVEVTIF